MRNPEVEGMPQVGVWYWVWLKPHWQLFVNTDVDADHVSYWTNVVRECVAYFYDIEADRILHTPRAFPRGRVTAGGGVYAILHGADTPNGCGGLAEVTREFGLAHALAVGMAIRAFHPHERINPEDRAALEALIGKVPS